MAEETTLRDITGKKRPDIVATPTQGLADQGFVPVGGTPSTNPLASQGDSPTTNVADVGAGGGILDETQTALDEEMSSLLTPEEVRAREAAQAEQMRALANDIFDPMMRRAADVGEKRLGSATGQIGVSRGLGFSSAKASYLASIEDQTQTAINEINSQKAAFIKGGAMEAAQRADEQISRLQELRINILTGKAELALSASAEKRAEEAAKLSSIATKYNIMKDIKEGDELTIDGQTFKGIAVPETNVEPFFKGSDIIDLMQSIPAGDSQTITDPNTGYEYTIYGTSEEDNETQRVESYNDAGELIVTTYRLDENGEMSFSDQKNFGKVGKTKTQAANTTLYLNNQEKTDLSTAMAALEANKGERYNSAEVAKQYRIYNQLHPGQGDQLLEAIKGEVNYNDQVIKELYGLNKDTTDEIEIQTSSGTVIKF